MNIKWRSTESRAEDSERDVEKKRIKQNGKKKLLIKDVLGSGGRARQNLVRIRRTRAPFSTFFEE